eukprot:CAMPEP_0174333350 /NCGR_PEP_ID=MMETSP0810-20121108/19082_1 /TAXON_ID=73025 ORGANISM="Eutreptiella gymnastica-like, Strain CCMP1594" /NCGR_SAMPLE_ID=MMETSP0810 /ASSEMBLY_ACC=CAM_ASM_000659 /LENGTH=46 /DNA_ID= /DNA_START= /DNA_END= /DNA_ORIENTATION=
MTVPVEDFSNGMALSMYCNAFSYCSARNDTLAILSYSAAISRELGL